MRQLMTALTMTSTLVLAAACGKKVAPEPATSAPPTTSSESTTKAPEPATTAAPTSAEPVKPPEPARPLLASTYDGHMLTPSAFAKTFSAWSDKDVVFAGHPMFFFDSDVLKGSVNFNADPTTSKEAKSALVGCTMKADETESLDKHKVLVMKGHIKGRFDKRIELVDCERVAVLDAMPTAVTAIDPDALDAEKPLPIKDFYDAFHGWAGKELHFVAHFNGSTSSHNDYGDSIRIDLYDVGGGLMDKVVACYVDSLPTPEQSDTSKTWHIKGTATGELAFDMPELKPCAIVEAAR